ncbi:CsbD family protein [Rothia sp. P6271]|uniref:CsbD family protein n=1 Tax=unclassified Rothia (in: high G+C Gram-positive bacteria) TaxID=2689056 RepID=UPI003ACAB83E
MSIGDKIQNGVEDATGKAKEAAGKVTDDSQLEAEGKVDQLKSTVKDGVEKVKDAAGDIIDSFKK